MSERVLIVDDHPLTSEALGRAPEPAGLHGRRPRGGRRRRRGGRPRLQPDVVLLDLSMQGMGGLQALPLIRRAAPSSEVVVLTASGTEDNLLAAIRAGAAGYLLKSEPPGRIVEFLRGVVRGEAALSGSVARRLLEQVERADARTRASPTRSRRC